MNSYGDPSSARGRSDMSGPSGEYGSAGNWPGNGGGYAADGQVPPPAPRAPASSGRATASVPPPGAGRASAPVPPIPGPAGRASGSVPSGRASAAVPVGRASAPVGGAPAGRAAVGGGTAGRATVGRASVRPVSPAAGGPPGAGGPGGPGGRGPRGRGAAALGPEGAAKAKRRKRINMVIGAFAVLIMLAGGTVVGATYYSTTVTLPADFGDKLELSSTLYYAGGKDKIAELGKVNRIYAKITDIPKHVQDAVASAEDRNFYEHQGIDYVGIARAAWNNLSGGSQQGASTITQQYARNAMDMTEVSYARKAKEAVLASKLNDQYSKGEIMEYYLNTIYFGRGAYSIESAAQAYFGKSIKNVTVEEAAVLAAVIKQPVPEAGGHKGYDPALNLQAAQDRWGYVVDGMAEKGWLPPGKERAKLAYPKTWKKWDDKSACGLECGLNTPAGNVINYVTQELADMKLCAPGHCMEEIRTQGLRITTSINRSMQRSAEAIASRRKGSELDGQPKNLQAALVSVDPKTGRVLAYYGGEKSTDTDWAGRNWQGGKWVGGHPPGSSFKIYTLVAALQNNISMQSHWQGNKVDGPFEIENAGRKATCGKWCTLDFSTVQSYNVPFFSVTQKVGVHSVLKASHDAGITMMWDTDGKPYEVAPLTTSEEKARNVFEYHVGFGQYGVTVLEHANGVATLANRGKYNEAHFVVKVEKKNRQTGTYELKGGEQLKSKQSIDQPVVDDITATLQKIPGSLKDGRKAAGKTGTWQLGNTNDGGNADAWMVGYTPQVATAVWVGNGNVKKLKPIKTKNGADIYGSGLPSDIWKRFMNKVHEGKDKVDFPPAPNIGDDSAGDGTEPPKKEDKKDDCTIPFFCEDNDGDNGGNNGGNNGGGNTPPTGLPSAPTFPPPDGNNRD